MNIIIHYYVARLAGINRKINKIHDKFDVLYDVKYPLDGKYIKKLEKKSEQLLLKKLALTARIRSRFGVATDKRIVKKIVYR